MGVKQLNKFLKLNCKNSIQKIDLGFLKNKKIVIDTSIYMYRYSGNKNLIESFYMMCSIFLKYEIVPLFVFDGKPPKEKENEIKKRNNDKKKAKSEYDKLKEKLLEVDDSDTKIEIESQMDKLRKKFLKIRKEDVTNVKKLIQSFGMSYIDAPEESDVMCAYMCNSNKVYACLSEDMDMFIYGCPIILRYFSLLKNNCIMYNLNDILNELNIDKENFKKLCILSGTDYNNRYMNIFESFNEWKNNNLSYDEDILNKINNLFNIDYDKYSKFNKYLIKNTHIKYQELKNILDIYNFIFL